MTSAQTARASFELVSTGNPGLDEITGGGIPEASVTVIAGAPGSGKTVLAMEMVFAHARRDRPVLYVTTLAEPSLKLLRYGQQFSFFDPDLVDRWVEFMDVGAQLLSNPDDALTAVAERVRARESSLVVIDSFKSIHDLLPPGRAASRSFVYRIAVSLAALGATTLLLGTYSDDDVTSLPEFAVADGIIRLGSRLSELATTRELQVVKLRGQGYVAGVHSFDITRDGLAVFPRVHAPELPTAESSEGPLSTGLPGLDDLLAGGVPVRSATLVEGGTGTGKTILSLAFLLEGARRGERGIYFGMDETPAQLRSLARTLGWDLADLEKRGLLLLHYTSPVELSTDRYLSEVRGEVTRTAARRVVLDSLSTMETSVPSRRRFKELIYALSKHMRAANVTLVMTMELAVSIGTLQLTGHAISSIADNVILLHYIELGARVGKTISVLKARGVAHKTELRSYQVTSGGPQVGDGPLAELRGVLTGLPVPISQPRDTTT